MATKFLDFPGLGHLWSKVTGYVNSKTAMATSTNLGTIKAPPKTDNQTQGVGIGTDGKLYVKAPDAPLYLTATLPVSGWSGSAPYTQSISVAGLLESDKPLIDVALTGTASADEPILAAWRLMSRITVADNTVTAVCNTTKPAADIPIKIGVIRECNVTGGGGGGPIGVTTSVSESSIVLPASGWTASGDVFVQSVSAPGITPDGSVIASPAPDSFYACGDAGIYCTGQAADSLTFACGERPGEDVGVTVFYFEPADPAGETPVPGGEVSEPYVLPVAGENLGGVKGAPPTAAQTEKAGIDGDGNILVTPPVDTSDKQNKINVTGILKGTGNGGVAKAVAGTDYQAPIADGTYATPAQVDGKQNKITASGLLKGGGSGNISAASPGTDYQAPITATGVLKGNGGGSVTTAAAGTDYAAPSSTKTANLTAAGWAGSGPYTQQVNVAGVTATGNIVVTPAPASFNEWVDAKVYCSAQAAGKLTFSCKTKPEAALTANILIVG